MEQAHNNQPRAALNGVTVIDLTEFETGPSCTEALAWLGADVIKVEPVQGDAGRRRTPEGVDSYYFMLLNANKRSVTVNLNDERGREILRGLIKRGDVFVENLGPGAIEQLGFPYRTVSELNPRMVYAQIKGFAPEGPYGNFLSSDVIAQSVGGVLSTTGEKGGTPLRAGPTIGDTGSALHTVIGILAALYQRQRTGRGQRVEVAMQDAVVNFGRMAYSSLALWGGHPPRNGNQSVLKGSAPSECYPCKGGGANDYCFVYCSRAGNHQWERLLKVIDREDLLNAAGYETPRARFAHQKEIDAIMEAWTLQHDKHEIMRILGTAGIPAGAVFDTQELRDDAYLRQRGTFVTVKHPVRGDFTMPGWPFKMSDSHVPVVTSPLLGQDNAEIYGEMLGYSAQQITQLKAENVI